MQLAHKVKYFCLDEEKKKEREKKKKKNQKNERNIAEQFSWDEKLICQICWVAISNCLIVLIVLMCCFGLSRPVPLSNSP